MSESENQDAQKQDVVATTSDAKPAEATEKPEHAHTTRKRAHKRQHRSHTGLWLLLVTIAIIAGAGFYGMQFITKSEQQISAQLNELQQSTRSLDSKNAQLVREFDNKIAALQTGQDELTKYLEVIRDKNTHLRKDWLVMEAEYLIQLANYRLLFERDVNTAIVALNSADLRLKDSGDPALLNVRKDIAESIQSLKQIEQVDLAGLSLTLSAVNKDLGKLALNTPDPVTKAQEVETELSEAKQVTTWTDLPAAMWRDIKNLIVIRDHEQPVGPLLNPEQRFFLVENLRLQLEQARLAMLSGQSEVFNERMQTAMLWINQHFDKEAALTKSTLDTLQQLSSANIAPVLPDISASYQSLQKYRANSELQTSPEASDKPASDVSGTN